MELIRQRPLLYYLSLIQFAGVTMIRINNPGPLDASIVCNSSKISAPKCGSSDPVHKWEDVRLDCSAVNALTVNYTKYLGLDTRVPLEDIDYYRIVEVRLECTDRDRGTPRVNCSNTRFNSARADQDIFTFVNLTEAGILPGATCFVSGCYTIEYDGEDINVLTPIKNCTIRGDSMPSVTPTTVLATTPTVVSTVPITEISSTIVSSMILMTTVKENINITDKKMMDSHLLSKILIPVILILLVFLLVTVFIIVQICVKQQISRGKKMFLVLDRSDMVFDPDHTPQVSIDKPSFSFSHRVSVISADFIQKLRPEDKTVHMPLENCGMGVAMKPGDSPHSNYAVHNSIRQSGGDLMDGSNELTWQSTDYFTQEQSVELPAASLDQQMRSSDTTLQLTVENEMCLSTVHVSRNAQTGTLTQDDSTLDTTEYSATLQPELTSDDNQVARLASLAVHDNMINLDLQEPTSNYQPSNLNQIPSFSHDIVHSISGDIVQLDLPENEEKNGDSSSQSQSYIFAITSQNNHQDQQIQFISTADTLFSQPLCSPITMLDDFEDNTTDLSALDEDVDGKLSSMDPTNFQHDDNLELDITKECHEKTTEQDVDRYDNIGQPRPASIQNDEDRLGLVDSAAEQISTLVEDVTTASRDDETHAFDSDKGSVVSVDFTGDVPDPQNHSGQLEMQLYQKRVRAPNANGYSYSDTEGNVEMLQTPSNFVSPPQHSFQSQYELGEYQMSLSFPSDSSPYFLGPRADDPTYVQCPT